MAQPVVHGVADLRSSSFNEPESLDGRWTFYWDRLLTPDQLSSRLGADSIYVPGSWHRQGYPSATGIATFKLLLLLPANQRDLLIYFPVINASAKFWLNGELLLETGKVSADPTEYKAKLASSILSLPSHTDSVELVVQIANFNYYSGGFGATPYVDKAAAHVARINRMNLSLIHISEPTRQP